MTTQTIEENSIQDRVYDICNELYAKNQKLSVRIVLSLLDNVRSVSTVHKYFKLWKDEQEANQKSLLEKMGFSEEFTRVFMTEISRHATEAEQRFKGIADDAKEQNSIAIEDLTRAEDRLHKQVALLEQREKEIKELKAEIAQSQKSQEAVQKELRQQINEQHKDKKELMQSNEHLRTEIAKIELKMEGNQELVDEVKMHNKDLSSENKQLNSEVVTMAKTIASLESTVEGNTQLIEHLQSNQVNIEKASDKLNQEHAFAITERSELRKELNSANKQLSDNKDKQTESLQTIADLKKTITEQSGVIETFTKNAD